MKALIPIPQAAMMAAATLLQQYIPDLTPQRLETLLTENRSEGNIPELSRKLTRSECAQILGVSINSVNRYIKNGRLKAINISPRLVRIDPESVQSLLTNGIPKDEVIIPKYCRKAGAR